MPEKPVIVAAPSMVMFPEPPVPTKIPAALPLTVPDVA
jgi:hypothetical protein